MTNKKKIILDCVEDKVSALLYYDRKECEDLRVGDIDKFIEEGFISVDEIASHFRVCLTEKLDVKLKDKDCTHKFVCADNPAVRGAEICVKCRQVRAKSD